MLPLSAYHGLYWCDDASYPITDLRFDGGELLIVADARGRAIPEAGVLYHLRVTDPDGRTVMEAAGASLGVWGRFDPEYQTIHQRVRLHKGAKVVSS